MQTLCKCGQPAVTVTASGIPLCELMSLLADLTLLTEVTQ